MVDSHLLTMFQKNQIEISTFTAPKIAVKVGVSNQLQGKSLAKPKPPAFFLFVKNHKITLKIKK
jgi:hypothetical protein